MWDDRDAYVYAWVSEQAWVAAVKVVFLALGTMPKHDVACWSAGLQHRGGPCVNLLGGREPVRNRFAMRS